LPPATERPQRSSLENRLPRPHLEYSLAHTPRWFLQLDDQAQPITARNDGNRQTLSGWQDPATSIAGSVDHPELGVDLAAAGQEPGILELDNRGLAALGSSGDEPG
jgi:hypothetical protein